jgi:hypothetical protein
VQQLIARAAIVGALIVLGCGGGGGKGDSIITVQSAAAVAPSGATRIRPGNEGDYDPFPYEDVYSGLS